MIINFIKSKYIYTSKVLLILLISNMCNTAAIADDCAPGDMECKNKNCAKDDVQCMIKNCAESDMKCKSDQGVNILTKLTCEFDGIENLLRSSFSHTCVPTPFFDFAIANIVSPVLYASFLLRLKINDDELFPDSCSSANRISFFDQKLSFALCNNEKLSKQMAEGGFNLVKNLIDGEKFDDAVRNAFTVEKSKYHVINKDIKPGTWGIMRDLLSVPPVYPWQVVQYRDQLCVATQGIAGWMNVGCRYMKEPYPDSIYDQNPNFRGAMNCSNIAAGSCYERAQANSANMLTITGPIVNCVKEMLMRLMVNPSYCGSDNKLITSIATDSKNIFFKFQQKMHQTVSTFLSIYVIFMGFNIILGAELPKKNEIIMYAMKIILVIYFSVGINTNYATHGFDGMTEWIFPLLLNMAGELTSWMLGSGISDLCNFSAVDYNNQDTWSLYSIWDALDCRISYYVGLNQLSDNSNSSKYLNYSIPPYIVFLIPAVISGNIQLIVLVISYPLLVISVAAYFVNTFCMSLISVVILGIMSPIFVPMALFEFTKGYFTSWAKLMISFTLQPLVVSSFMIIMFSIFDQAFYSNCLYNSLTTKSNNVTKKIFFLNTNPNDYSTPKAYAQCFTSLGGRFNYVQSLMVNGAIMAMQVTGNIQSSQKTSNGGTAYSTSTNIFTNTGQAQPAQPNNSPFVSSQSTSQGIFTQTTTIIFEFIRDMIWSLFSCCVILYLMRHFAEQLANFAADITEGPSLGASATALYNKVNEIADKSGKGDGGTQ